MQAFANSRLLSLPLPQPPPAVAARSSSAKLKANSAANGASKASSAASSSAGAKRKRGGDALFALDSDESDDEAGGADDEDDGAMRDEPTRAAAKSHGRVQRDDGAAASRASAAAASTSAQPAAKKSRNAPEERSSKKQVASGLLVTNLPSLNIEKKRRDPRFDPLCGEFDAKHFHAHYAFMGEEKQQEVAEWKQQLQSGKRGKQTLTDEDREMLRANIQRTQQEVAATKRTTGESALLQEWKRGERAAQKEGKKPFFLKKSEQKKLQLAARYLELKSEKGKLQKFLVKKTKDVKNKDHRLMPREGREE